MVCEAQRRRSFKCAWATGNQVENWRGWAETGFYMGRGQFCRISAYAMTINMTMNMCMHISISIPILILILTPILISIPIIIYSCTDADAGTHTYT